MQHFRLNTDPDPDPSPGFDDQKCKKIYSGKKFLIFLLIPRSP
jgi:hypothetical protein